MPVASREWQRIVVLGGPGSGKTHVARRLGAALRLPVAHLDTLRYEPGWRRAGDAVFRERIGQALAGERWIADGLYLLQAADLCVPRADVVIWLEQPAWRRLWRCLQRTVTHWGRPRADRPEGCPERIDPAFLHYAATFDRWRPMVEGLLAVYPDATVLRVVGDRGVRELLDGL